MTQVLTVPDIEFTGFYYPEILREILLDLRNNAGELGLTDENAFEVHTQLCRAFALVGHLNNCRTDTVASELLIGSLSLLESLKRLLRLIGQELASATPAAVDVLLKLSEVTSSTITDFIPELSEFSTEGVPPIPFEDLVGLDVNRTDQISYAYGLEQTKSGTEGYVTTINADVFYRSGGDDTFAAGTVPTGDVNAHIFVQAGANAGEYRITEWISANSVRVVRIPGSTGPGFQDETDITWTLKEFTDNGATNLNSSGPTFTPWDDVVAGDALYIGHAQVMWDQLDVVLDTVGADLTGVWEYFDDTHSRFNPIDAEDNGDGTITFDIASLLGTSDRNGARVTVEFTPTGTTETVLSTWAGGENRIVTVGALGQTTISEDVEDYLITADWVPFPNQIDGAADFTVDGAVAYTFPQTDERNWQSTDVNLQEGHWARYRVISVSTPTEPILDEIDIDSGGQYLVRTCAQGETVGPEIVGSSDGSASQEFTLSDSPYFDDSEIIEVDEAGSGTWLVYTLSQNFLDSSATSRHYVREVNANDECTIRFGDGVNGKIPPYGLDNVRATYRIGGDVSGNVGIGEVTVNADGVQRISEVSNPRPAEGWLMKDGGTDADIERLKRDAPAALRTRDTAVTPDDMPRLAYKFVSTAGIKPVARAFAVEEGLGPKTVKLQVVGIGGRVLTSVEREELDAYFNGDRYASPPTSGVLMMNYACTTFNFEPQQIDVRCTVVWPGGNTEVIRNSLLALITPLALEEDNTTYAWDFGGYVSLSRIYSEIHAVDPNIVDVPTLEISDDGGSSWQSSNILLDTNELPTSIASAISINIQQTS